jgi:hypothetical protein
LLALKIKVFKRNVNFFSDSRRHSQESSPQYPIYTRWYDYDNKFRLYGIFYD